MSIESGVFHFCTEAMSSKNNNKLVSVSPALGKLESQGILLPRNLPLKLTEFYSFNLPISPFLKVPIYEPHVQSKKQVRKNFVYFPVLYSAVQ